MKGNNLAFNLRMLRTAREITAKQLSLELNSVEYRISEIEKRNNIRITNDEIIQIANYFNVSVEDLLYKKVTIIFM